jgi:hypothetical protein
MQAFGVAIGGKRIELVGVVSIKHKRRLAGTVGGGEGCPYRRWLLRCGSLVEERFEPVNLNVRPRICNDEDQSVN